MRKKLMNNIYLTIRKTFRDSRNSLVWMFVTSLIVGGIMVAMFPSIKEAGQDLVEYMDSFPKEFLDAFGITSFDMSKFEVYISTEYFGFFWAMAFFPFIIAWSSMFAKSAEDGTMGLLLSYPISRVELVISYLFDAIGKSFLTALVIVGVVWAMSYMVDAEPIFENWLFFTLIIALFLSAVAVLTVLLSVIFRRRGLVVGAAAGLVLGSYFLNVISRLYEEVESIKYLSLFHYYGDPVDVLLRGEFDATSMLLYLVVIVLGSAAAVFIGRSIQLPKG